MEKFGMGQRFFVKKRANQQATLAKGEYTITIGQMTNNEIPEERKKMPYPMWGKTSF